ncbi:MAG: hypothetical protein OXL41_15600 [Nitrospinae bacterium]|nr:hypothetical protein [Nitrospinota bacterium]
MLLSLVLGNQPYIEGNKILTKVATKTQADGANLREKVRRWLSGGKRISSYIEEMIIGAQIELEEIYNLPLHVFHPRLLRGAKLLNVAEAEAKRIIRSKSELTPNGFVEALMPIAPIAAPLIDLALSEQINASLNNERLTDRLIHDRGMMTNHYSAGQALHSYVTLWDETCQHSKMCDDRDAFDFHHLEIGPVKTIIDVAELAFELYSDTESVLKKMKWRKVAPIDQLAESNRQIVQMNLVSISSYARGWLQMEDKWLYALSGVEAQEAKSRLKPIAEKTASFEEAVKLMDTHRNHLFLAWNIAYYAVEAENRDVAKQAAKRLAEITGINEDKVWREKIADEPSLCDEPYIKDKFDNGIPKILR